MNAHKWQWKRNTISQRTYRHFIKCLPENPNGVESPDRVLVPECEQCKVSLRVAPLIYLCRISYGTCKNRQTEYLISNWNKINLHAIVIVNYFQYPVSFSMPCIFYGTSGNSLPKPKIDILVYLVSIAASILIS